MNFIGSILTTGLTTYLTTRSADQARDDANAAADREFALAQASQANTSNITRAIAAVVVIGGGFLLIKKLRG